MSFFLPCRSCRACCCALSSPTETVSCRQERMELNQDRPDELLRLDEASAIPMRFCIEGNVKLAEASAGGDGGGFGD